MEGRMTEDLAAASETFNHFSSVYFDFLFVLCFFFIGASVLLSF